MLVIGSGEDEGISDEGIGDEDEDMMGYEDKREKVRALASVPLKVFAELSGRSPNSADTLSGRTWPFDASSGPTTIVWWTHGGTTLPTHQYPYGRLKCGVADSRRSNT